MKESLELWAGCECSVVRVGDAYVDQIAETGHDARRDDLERLAELGARAVRYPVIWERTSRGRIEDADWSFADERLGRLRELGVRPIVGLVHHGSGPPSTSLVDDSFVTGLASFARAVAERYPWVTDYTPVNEPLTTARFSALYGHWYPHARDDAAFVRALVLQCAATRSAMRAVRAVNPHARLVQTEDAATVFSTPHLGYQAHFENLRRFTSLDLLTGRFGTDHPMHAFFVERGAPMQLVDSFTSDPCSPDVIGLNYYVTSDRFLDEQVERYPLHARGGNHREAYADVEAVRARPEGIAGHGQVLEDFWNRYHIALALTEVHIGCAPEEQVRWFAEAWNAATDARERGIDVRAVTAWSVFGAYDWDSLLTQRRGHYEPGVFDVRGGCVRRTALAPVVRDFATTGRSDHPMLDAAGWWHGQPRLLYGVERRTEPRRVGRAQSLAPLLVTGAGGTLGRALVQACRERGLPAVALGRSELDVADREAVAAVIARIRPWAVVNAAGYVRVDEAERDPARCFRENCDAVAALAVACEEQRVRLATFSSDLVFDGALSRPHVEDDAVSPLNVYGMSKARAEAILRASSAESLVIRTSAFFGPLDVHNFVVRTLERLRAGCTTHVVIDQTVSPTYVPDLAHAVLSLLVDRASGVWHLANRGAVSWWELAARAAERAGVGTSMLVPCTTEELDLPAARPRYSVLGSARGALMPSLDDALARFFEAWSPVDRARESAE